MRCRHFPNDFDGKDCLLNPCTPCIVVKPEPDIRTPCREDAGNDSYDCRISPCMFCMGPPTK